MKTKQSKVTRRITMALSAIMLSEQLAGTGAVLYAHAEDEIKTEYKIEHSVTSSWDGGCNANIILTNLADRDTQDWSITFSTTDKITNLWGGTITECLEFKTAEEEADIEELEEADDKFEDIFESAFKDEFEDDIFADFSDEFEEEIEEEVEEEYIETPDEENEVENTVEVSENATENVTSEEVDVAEPTVVEAETADETVEAAEATEETEEVIVETQEYDFEAPVVEEHEVYYQYTVKALDYNAVIKAGESVTIGYMAEGNNHDIWDEKAAITLKEAEKAAAIPVGGTYEYDDYTVEVKIPAYWDGAYNVQVLITNTSDETIHNWAFVMETANTISGLYNAVEVSENDSEEDNVHLIKNAGHNQDIPVGGTVELGYTAYYEDEVDVPNGFALSQIETEVTTAECEVSLFISDEWEEGGLAQIIIKNISELPIEDWMIEFDSALDIKEVWGGVIDSHDGEHYFIRNAGYGQNIMPGESWTVGILFNGECSDIYSIVTKQIVIDGKRSYINQDTDEDFISINTDDLLYIESIDSYSIDKQLDSIMGSIKSIDGLKEFTIDICDINNNVIYTADIDPVIEWKVEAPGLVVGVNYIDINVLFEDFKEYHKQMTIFSSSSENMKFSIVDNDDDDGDGISNYYENLIGLDKNAEDTDNDGLSDIYEITVTLTNPADNDTDHNAIYDGDEDPDQDQLSNHDEMKFGTNPLSQDSDYDGLSDYEEIYIYGSSALKYDTDDDGLSDGIDVDCNLDPTLYDTNDDGISDSEEIVYQTIKCDNISNNAIEEVSITLKCKAENHDDFMIVDSSDYDYLSANVCGIIGCPVEIVSPINFDSAKITFSYNEDALGNTKEDDLCMMWYDTENLEYILLDDCVVDKQLNTVTYETTHFSTYLLVDKTIWLDAWRNPINYKNSTNTKPNVDYDVVFMLDYTVTPEELLYEKKIVRNIISGLKSSDRVMICGYTNDNALYTMKWYSDKTSASVILNNFENYASKQDFSITASGLHDGRFDYALGCVAMAANMGDNIGNKKVCFIINNGETAYIVGSVLDNSTKSYKNELDLIGVNLCNISISTSVSNYINDIIGEEGESFIAKTTGEYQEEIQDMFKYDQYNNGITATDFDLQDSDGDGIYDTYEINGMMIQNGTVVYTDPFNTDTDGDGINDCDEMGGLPANWQDSFMEVPLTSVIWHQVSDPTNEKISQFEEKYMLVDDMNYWPYKQETYETIFVSNTGEYDSNGHIIYGRRNIYGSNLSKLTQEEIDGILTRVFLTINLGRTYDVASTNLEYYIFGDSERRVYNMEAVNVKREKVLGVTPNAFDENMYHALRSVSLYMQETNKSEIIFTLKPDTPRAGVNFEKTDFNLFAGIHDADASYVVKATRQNDEYSFQIRYYIMDYYDWDPEKTYPVGLVSPRDLHNLLYVKVGRNYENWGYKYVEASFNTEGVILTDENAGIYVNNLLISLHPALTFMLM